MAKEQFVNKAITIMQITRRLKVGGKRLDCQGMENERERDSVDNTELYWSVSIHIYSDMYVVAMAYNIFSFDIIL